MIKEIANATIAVLDMLHGGKVHRATKYMETNLVVRATRPLSGPVGKRRIDRRENFTVLLTIGKPNHRERDFIKMCKKAGEPFPVKNIQLKFPPVPRKKRK